MERVKEKQSLEQLSRLLTLTIEQAATLANLPIVQLEEAIANGELKSIIISKRQKRIKRSVLDAFVESL